MVKYNLHPLSGGTDIDKAIWSGLEMLVSNYEEPEDDFDMLQTRMYGTGQEYKQDDLSSIVAKYRKKVEYSCLIIFTDGEFDQPAGNKHRMSIYKQLRLCKDLGVKVYVISVEVVDPLVLRYTNDTGGYAQIFKGFEQKQFEKAYESIVQSQSKDEIVVDRQVKRSLSWLFGIMALVLLGLYFFLNVTSKRNFTQI